MPVERKPLIEKRYRKMILSLDPGSISPETLCTALVSDPVMVDHGSGDLLRDAVMHLQSVSQLDF
jgi:hypothetical protein